MSDNADFDCWETGHTPGAGIAAPQGGAGRVTAAGVPHDRHDDEDDNDVSGIAQDDDDVTDADPKDDDDDDDDDAEDDALNDLGDKTGAQVSGQPLPLCV